MANANPTEFLGKPKGWYGAETPQPGLSPVSTMKPKNPTRVERVSCPGCGNRFKLSDVTPSVVCECGKTVTLPNQK